MGNTGQAKEVQSRYQAKMDVWQGSQLLSLSLCKEHVTNGFFNGGNGSSRGWVPHTDPRSSTGIPHGVSMVGSTINVVPSFIPSLQCEEFSFPWCPQFDPSFQIGRGLFC
eukprot:12032645-Ditylum_brightwellii.AAC.2